MRNGGVEPVNFDVVDDDDDGGDVCNMIVDCQTKLRHQGYTVTVHSMAWWCNG